MNPEFTKYDGHLEIPSSKFKLTLLFLIALACLIGGIFFISNPEKFAESDPHHYPVLFIYFVGCVCVLFGITGAILFTIKFFSKKPGFIADQSGIYINGSQSGFVKWTDIEKFGVKQIKRSKLIEIYLKNPIEYAESQTNWLKRKALINGFPLSITTSSLNCSFDDLYSFLNKKLQSR